MKFLVIGGDAAGMSAASKAKRLDPDIEVTVLEKTFDVSYSACGMPYNIADPDRSIDDLVVRDAKTFIEKNRINLLTGHEARKIDRENRTVEGFASDGETFAYGYDRLLIATGASARVLDIPGTDLDGVLVLKSLEDGRKIKSCIERKQVKKAVIAGMGYISLEMAEALHERSVHVQMVKPGKKLLPWMSRDLADVVNQELEAEGVTLYPGHAVKRIEKTGGNLTVVCEGLDLDADMVILAVGVAPNSRIASEAGLETGIGGAVAVDQFCRTSDENIYSAGDCADAFHVVTGEKCYIPLALRANRAGWAVADNVCGGRTALQGVAGTAVFKVFDLEVARTGLTTKEAADAGFDPVEETIRSSSRAHSYPGAHPVHVAMVGDRKTRRLLGVQMVGKEGVAHRINAPAVALHTHMTVDAFSQTDLAYAPPFGPTWDPMLTCANQLLKKLKD
ncbi:MAG: FAD-dependent oxidoreductase [Desulfobacteraceae bacterium]